MPRSPVPIKFMPPRLSWIRLLPGIALSIATLVIAAAVLLFAATARMRGEKIGINVLASHARGVMRGTEVWLAGQPVGVVENVRFRHPATESDARVLIETSVRRRDATQLRHDSRVEIRTGANVVGPIVVYFTAGTPASAPLGNGDTIRADLQPDRVIAAEHLVAASQNLAPLLADLRTIGNRLHDTAGTIGAFLSGNGEAMRALEDLQASADALRDRGTNGNGSEVHPPGIFDHARTALARADSITTLLRSDKTSLGRLRRDASLAAAVSDVTEELTRVRALLSQPTGTLGRHALDSALARSIDLTRSEMALLLTDIRKRPLRYLHY